MASRKVARWRAAIPLAIAVGLGRPSVVGAAAPAPVLERGELIAAQQEIVALLLQTYEETDWSEAGEYLAADPTGIGNPNVVFIAVSLGNAHALRFEKSGSREDLNRAFAWWEWVVQNHWLWGERWLSAPLVSYLDLSLKRVQDAYGLEISDRMNTLWLEAMRITEIEADLRLSTMYPHWPYDSATTGDSKAEENAWESALLAAAANFLPEHPHASAWDRKARQLAYNAISRPSDPPDLEGLKVSTVTEDLSLSNHGYHPNPTYIAATLLLLSQGALAYEVSGRAIPSEFEHNVVALYEVYKSYVTDDLRWRVPADPEGSACLFPFAFDPEFEARAVRCKKGEGYLWQRTDPVMTMVPGQPLWEAVLNSKVVMFYLLGSYMWRSSPAARQ